MANDITEQTKKLLPWIVAIAFFMQSLDATILNIALPAIAEDLAIHPLGMQSAVIAYMVTVALIIPICGWVSDRFGTQKIFFIAVAFFSLGSILCAAAPSLLVLVVGRVVQGIGGALMMPVGRLVILRVYPRREFVKVMSFVTIPGLLGPLLGPTVGGWLVQYCSWHWIFLINVPIGVLGCIAAYKFMPDLTGVVHKKLDLIGFILIGLAMVLVSFALEGLAELYLDKTAVIILSMVGISCLIGYWYHAVHIEHPLFPLKLFNIKSFSIGILGNLIARLGNGSLPFLIPLLLQLALGYSPAQAGMMMIPTALLAILIKPVIGLVINYFGYRWVLTVNTLLLGIIICSFALVSNQTPFVLLLAMLAAVGAVNSLQFTSMNTVTLLQLDDELASSGNALLAVGVQLSISFGIAIAAILLAFFNGSQPIMESVKVLPAFQQTFFIMGLFTVMSAFVFFQLPKDM